MTNHEVPLYMNGKVIGRISVQRETGEFIGQFDPEIMPILEEGMDSGVQSVTFESLYGLFAHTYLNAQQRLSAYLDHGQNVVDLEEKHCSRIDPHYGHVWEPLNTANISYYCVGNVVEDDMSFYTIREALGEGRVFRRNVYGLRNAEAEAKRYYEMTKAHITWEKQSGYIV